MQGILVFAEIGFFKCLLLCSMFIYKDILLEWLLSMGKQIVFCYESIGNKKRTELMPFVIWRHNTVLSWLLVFWHIQTKAEAQRQSRSFHLFCSGKTSKDELVLQSNTANSKSIYSLIFIYFQRICLVPQHIVKATFEDVVDCVDTLMRHGRSWP